MCGLVIANWIAGALSPALSRTAAELDLNSAPTGGWSSSRHLWRLSARHSSRWCQQSGQPTFVWQPDCRNKPDVNDSSAARCSPRMDLSPFRWRCRCCSWRQRPCSFARCRICAPCKPGSIPSKLLIFRVDPSRNGYTLEQSQELFAQAQERLATLPGVRSATLMNIPLISGGGAQTIAALPEAHLHTRTGHPGSRAFFDSHRTWALTSAIKFFSTMAIPMLQGRAPDARDVFEGPAVAVINRALAMQLFGNDRRARQTVQDRLEARCPTERGHRRIRRCKDPRRSGVTRRRTAYFSYRQRGCAPQRSPSKQQAIRSPSAAPRAKPYVSSIPTCRSTH